MPGVDMGGVRPVWAVVAWVLMLVCTPAAASEPVPIPEKDAAELYLDVPAPWRDYLIQARAAERIEDPLQRCLAFPDLPGNRWPEGHAQAHCRTHFASKGLTPAEIEGMLDRGELKQLENLLDDRFRRHFLDKDYSEVIHDDLDFRVDDAGLNGRVAEKWLELAPDSAYANAAYGNFLMRSAWKARGGRYASETPRDNLRRMGKLAEQAVPYLEKALSINPKLLPAYEGLIELARLDSRDELGERALLAARKVDPACANIAGSHMDSLTPRWGGSYEQMLAYANELSAHIDRRPQLAIYLARPYADRGDRLVAAKQYTAETLKLLEVAISIGSDEGALRDAADVAGVLTDAAPDQVKRLAYLLQESRFRETNAWGMREMARILAHQEPQWSLKYALRALEQEPDHALGRYLAGVGYNGAGHQEDADREYRIAIENSGYRQASLREVAHMWIFNARHDDKSVSELALARAKPYIDRLITEYPEDGMGWILRWYWDASSVSGANPKEIPSILAKLDRGDAWQVRLARLLEDVNSRKSTDPIFIRRYEN